MELLLLVLLSASLSARAGNVSAPQHGGNDQSQSKAFGDRSLIQFWGMIKCYLPNSYPMLNFINYGCFCGVGGHGTPVDQLDQCCFQHDRCYSQSHSLSACCPVLDHPYTKIYDYDCDKTSRTVTCLSSNSECGMFICECDRVASACFAQSPYNISLQHLKESGCSSAPQGFGRTRALAALPAALIFMLLLT